MDRDNKNLFRAIGCLCVASGLILCATGCGPFGSAVSHMTDAQKRQAIDQMFSKYAHSFPDVTNITPAQLREMEAKGDTVLVDVRTPQERAVAVIPGAVSVNEYEAHPEQYAGKRVVGYCTIGYRSGEYVEDLVRKGVKAYNLKGSILAWVYDGGEVVDAKGQPTRTVNVYGKEWDLLPSGYQGVW